MTGKYNFGNEKPCTKFQLEDEVEDLYSKCTLEGVGTFYFCYGKPSEGVAGRFDVNLKFFEDGDSILRTAKGKAFCAQRYTPQ